MKRWLFLISLMACCLMILPAVTARAASVWSWANPRPQGNDLNASCTDGSVSVAVGGGGTVYSNANGQWTLAPTPTTSNLNAVACGGGTFVAAGQGNTVLYSNNGATWSQATLAGATQNLYSIAYGNGVFVAAGTAGTVYTSSNGSTWTESNVAGSTTASTVTGLAYGAGVFVAVTHSSTGQTIIYYSSNGTTWQQANVATSPADPSVYVAYNGTSFVALGLNLRGTTGASVMTSPGGKTWTLQNPLSPATSNTISITTSGSDFVVLLQSKASPTGVTTPLEIETSTDGVNWTNAGSGNNLPATWSQNIPRAISYTGSSYLVVGASAYLATSPTLVNWTPIPIVQSVTYQHMRGAHWLNGAFYAVGDDDTVLTSTDGVTWKKESFSVSDPSNLRDIAYGNGTYVIVGSNGVVLTSTDGSSWSAQVIKSATNTLLEALCWNGKLFVAVGTGGAIFTSPNGVTWTQQTSGTTSNLWGVAWTGTRFVAVSDSSQDNVRVLISTGGTSWSPVPFNTGFYTSLFNIRWSGTELIASGGAANSQNQPVGIIATSPDGINWTVDYSSLSDTFSDAMLNGKDFVAIGQNSGDVYTSTDGTNWTLQTPGLQDYGLQYLAKYDGTIIATGYAGTLLYTTNQPPTANNGSVSTTENTPVNGTLQSTGASASYAIVTQPAHGNVVLDAITGPFTYTPASGYTGTDSFTFTASNSAGTSNVATESIVVNATATVPTAQNGSVSTQENQPVSGTLQATGGATAFQIATQPAHGKVTLAATSGSFTYTPDTNYSGSDSFTFTASDSAGTSSPATESVTVTASTSTPTSTSGNSTGGGGGGGLGILTLMLLFVSVALKRGLRRSHD